MTDPQARATIERGSLLFFRMLDVAEEFDLARAESLIRAEGPEVRRVELRQESSAALTLESLPIEVVLGRRQVSIDAVRTVDVIASARLYRFGAVSVVFETEIAPGTSIAELVPLVSAAWESVALDEAARAIVKELERALGAVAGQKLHVSPVIERYGIVLAREVSGDPLSDPDALARVLLGEADPRELSPSARQDALRQQFRYFTDDLAIVHTASAFVLEPTENRDVVLALELASTQLLELRTYDALIDRELDRVYHELARAKGAGWWLFGQRHRALSREVQEQLVELAELTDRAVSAVKVASDGYLAHIYLSALERMHTGAWRESVTRKLDLFARVYGVLKEESHGQRTLIVEVVVVLLIAFEIVMALRGE